MSQEFQALFYVINCEIVNLRFYSLGKCQTSLLGSHILSNSLKVYLWWGWTSAKGHILWAISPWSHKKPPVELYTYELCLTGRTCLKDVEEPIVERAAVSVNQVVNTHRLYTRYTNDNPTDKQTETERGTNRDEERLEGTTLNKKNTWRIIWTLVRRVDDELKEPLLLYGLSLTSDLLLSWKFKKVSPWAGRTRKAPPPHTVLPSPPIVCKKKWATSPLSSPPLTMTTAKDTTNAKWPSAPCSSEHLCPILCDVVFIVTSFALMFAMFVRTHMFSIVIYFKVKVEMSLKGDSWCITTFLGPFSWSSYLWQPVSMVLVGLWLASAST